MFEDLRAHRNAEERHRELGMTPKEAWDLARKGKRDVLRPYRPDAWWHYVGSSRTGIRVGDDGRVPVAGQRLIVQAPRRTRLVHCLHTNGSISILAGKPYKKQRPQILLHLGPKLE